ncbi:helix-turn-helix transcriptional regulator [Pseudomonas sp. NFXW11]|uniref:helix-turn-helix domain-containing protein n=1 Tax=Pseudomonas sp. NFXW11 TaxID=2819531 RepID=UPI003CF1A406
MSPTAQFWRDPQLPYAESRRACDSRANYKAHSHPSVSIGAVDQGRSLFTGASTGPTLIHPGSLVWVPAHCTHACNPQPGQAWSYQMLHLDAAWLQGIYQELQLSAPQQVVLSNDQALYRHFCRLNQLLFADGDWQDKEAALIEFVGDFPSHGHALMRPAAEPARASAAVRRVMQLLQQEPQEPQPLEQLAHIAGLSRYQLIRAFRAASGMTPHAYQLNQRIIQARASLQAGEASAALAQRLGFADQAHFQRVFKAHVGVTPGSYKA